MNPCSASRLASPQLNGLTGRKNRSLGWRAEAMPAAARTMDVRLSDATQTWDCSYPARRLQANRRSAMALRAEANFLCESWSESKTDCHEATSVMRIMYRHLLCISSASHWSGCRQEKNDDKMFFLSLLFLFLWVHFLISDFSSPRLLIHLQPDIRRINERSAKDPLNGAIASIDILNIIPNSTSLSFQNNTRIVFSIWAKHPPSKST